MLEILSFPFAQRAIIAAILIAFVASYYGVFVVQRRMSFLGSGLSHAAFGGVALGMLLGIEPMIVAIPFTVLVAILIAFLKNKSKLAADTSIGVLFSVSVALGIIFLSLKDDYSVDAFSYLFGSILYVQQIDILFASILALLTISSFGKLWRRWAYSTFDSELARADRQNIDFDDLLLSVLIAISIVISIKIVGIVLIAAFLVLPSASARLVSSTFLKMTINSIIFGVLGSVAGLFLSFIFDMASGATIILTQATIFIGCLLISKFR